MTRLKWMILLFVFCCLRPAFAQGPHNSANSCPEPDVNHSHWRFLGRNPVGKPIRNESDLAEFLAPVEQGGRKLYNKPWQQIARAEWKLSEEALQRLYIEAGQGNFTREMVPSCALFGDMIYDIPATVLGKVILADWEDKGSKSAWVYVLDGEVSGTKGKLKMYFFEGCSNPSYQFIAETKNAEVTVPPPPEEKPKPSPRTETPPPVECPRCPPPQVVSCPAVDIETSASWGQRLFGGLPEFALSAGIGGGVAAVTSSDSERRLAGYHSAVYSAGANRLVNIFNPDHNRAIITVGEQAVRLKQGDKVNVPNIPDGQAEWVNGTIRVYQGRVFCGFAKPKSTFNLTPVPVIKRVIELELPVKQSFTPPPNINQPADKTPFTPPPNTSRPINP